MNSIIFIIIICLEIIIFFIVLRKYIKRIDDLESEKAKIVAEREEIERAAIYRTTHMRNFLTELQRIAMGVSDFNIYPRNINDVYRQIIWIWNSIGEDLDKRTIMTRKDEKEYMEEVMKYPRGIIYE